jgi:ABC-type branched-subunit amino acid transport system substrate-binding protein
MGWTRVKSGVAASGLGLLLLLAACASDDGSEPDETVQPPQAEVESQPPPEVRVGLLLPLTGAAAELGEDMLDAAQMALFDVGPNELILLPRDTAGTPQVARQAAEQVIEEGAVVILGPLFNQAVSAVSPVAAQGAVRVLAFSNVSAAAAQGTFLLGFRPEEQVERVVRYALEHVERRPDDATLAGIAPRPGAAGQGATDAADPGLAPDGFAAGPVRIAGLAPDDAYGTTAMEALRRTVLAAGGELGQTLFYPPDQADPSSVVRQIAAYDARKAALERERARLQQLNDASSKQALQRLSTVDTLGGPPFDAILIADGGDRLRSVASLLTFFDVDPAVIRFIGTMRWQDDPRVLQEAALQGSWFAASDPDGVAEFERRFQEVYGHPPQPLSALAYDATALAVIVARDLRDPKFEPPTLTNAQGFAGATGLFRLRQDGLAEHGLAILEVAGGRARTIEPPPASFSDQLAGG